MARILPDRIVKRFLSLSVFPTTRAFPTALALFFHRFGRQFGLRAALCGKRDPVGPIP